MRHFISTVAALVFAAAGISQSAMAQNTQRVVDFSGTNELTGPIIGRNELVQASKNTDRIAIHIPDFQEGDSQEFLYQVTHFGENIASSATAWPDENGVLSINRPVRTMRNGEVIPVRHIYLYSEHRRTGEIRYTLNMEDIPFVSFVRSLAMSLATLQPPTSQGQSPSPAPRVRTEVADPFAQDLVIPSLKGENLTFEETLDLLRRASGCDVIQVEGKLIIDWCG